MPGQRGLPNDPAMNLVDHCVSRFVSSAKMGFFLPLECCFNLLLISSPQSGSLGEPLPFQLLRP